MDYIFVDNYRGFDSTLLPIKDVNFFVGENSSGKTSLMSLLSLFHSTALWVSGKFSSPEDEIDLGNYEDIVSMHAEDKRYFHVGALTEEEDKKKGCEGFLMTFSNRDGMPGIHRYTMVSENKKGEIKFRGNRTFFRMGEAERISEGPASVRDLFMKWVENHEKEEIGFSELKRLRLQRSLGAITALLRDMIKGRAASGRGITFTLISFYHNLFWLAPIRTKPEPIYSRYETRRSPEGHHTAYSIKRLLEKRETAEKFRRFVRRFGKASGLFESVEIRKYGKRKAAPFEVRILLSGKAAKISNVGYGVSQALPIIVDLFEQPEGCAYAIQQPEIHLHPRGQAALGDLLYNLAVTEDKKFVVETQSDFIIDRFRMNFRSGRRKKRPESQIVYFEKSSEGNKLTTIDIDEKGNVSKDQPKGYREFFLREDLRVLGY